MAKANSILALIEADHQKVEQLFTESETTKGVKKSQEIFNQIYKGLTLHAKAEELVFYPAMREYEETQQYLEEAEQEHNSAKILLEEMKTLNPSDDEFKTKMQSLKETIRHHVAEEESEIFDAVRECMDDEELKQLGQEFQDAKARIEPEIELAMA
ncbi:MAG: hemerythrin domain-containing protein [Cyanobacteria bacterium CRU_2_1]|nr:hemerythrin domain-containing protein [Cyanobacteria bacterium CRU_2_1]